MPLRPLPAIAQSVALLLTSLRVGVLAFVQAHPKRISTAVGAVLLGAGATAFGIAPYLPDPSTMVVRQVEEAVTAQEVTPQIEALREHSFELYRSDTLASGENLDAVFKRLGVQDAAATAFIRTDANAKQLLGRYSKQVSVSTTEGQRLKTLTARWISDDSGRFNRLTIEPTETSWVSRLEQGELQAHVSLATGVIRTSLFAATDDAKLPDAVATQLVRLFEGDVDFHRGMRKGDRFSLQYETLLADGEIVKTGKVLSAELTNAGTAYTAMWFDLGGGKGDYYSFDGQSRKRTYLASPLEFSRVSSGFAMRMHPIHKTWKRHLGVDYAAATGTPIRSVGDGVVVQAGWNASGYGNVVEVRHSNASHTTLYAHMSRVVVKKGQRVSQGNVLGNVGSTGWATGPHLHFEFRVGGVHQDPQRLVRAKETIPLPVAAKPAFDKQVTEAKLSMAQIASLVPSRAQ